MCPFAPKRAKAKLPNKGSKWLQFSVSYFYPNVFQIIPHHLHILPNLALLVRVAEEICRVKCRHHLDAEIIVKMPAHFRDRCFCLEQIVRRGSTENNDHFRPDNRDLA